MIARHALTSMLRMATRSATLASRFSTTARIASHKAGQASGGGLGTWYNTESTADAVYNILYQTPTVKKTTNSVHILNCFMQDEPGILTRATGIMAARGYNIDSVVVSRTEIPGLSRMTITVKGEKAVVQQARKQLEDLPQVWAVVDLTNIKAVEREVVLIKLSTLGPDHIICNVNTCTPRQPMAPSEIEKIEKTLIKERKEELEAELPLSMSEPHIQMMESGRRLTYIRSLTDMFGAKIVDVGAESCIIELCAKSERIDAFMKLVAPFGILEAARSGRMAMSRTAKLSLFEDHDPATVEEEEALVMESPDLSNLPPS